MGVHDVRDLAAYQLCEQLMVAVEAATATLPASSDRRFCNQINDAALDAASDVNEGFVRYYPLEFARFLDYALASLEEVRCRAEAGFRRKYLTVEQASAILHAWVRADKAVRGLRAYLWTVKKADLPPRPSRIRPPLRRRSRPRTTVTGE